MTTVASQRGTAKPIFSDSCVVGVKVYGSRPNMLSVMRKSIKDVRMRAHLWPPTFRGKRSCCVNRLINQFCSVSKRLFIHRTCGAGSRIQGSVRARAIRGIPSNEGLINWSKKLSVMVRIRALFWIFPCFEGRVRLGKCGLKLLEGGQLGKLVRRKSGW